MIEQRRQSILEKESEKKMPAILGKKGRAEWLHTCKSKLLFVEICEISLYFRKKLQWGKAAIVIECSSIAMGVSHTQTQTPTPKRLECGGKQRLTKRTQSASSYLQFGGGSKVISASSFWILQPDKKKVHITVVWTHA